MATLLMPPSPRCRPIAELLLLHLTTHAEATAAAPLSTATPHAAPQQSGRETAGPLQGLRDPCLGRHCDAPPHLTNPSRRPMLRDMPERPGAAEPVVQRPYPPAGLDPRRRSSSMPPSHGPLALFRPGARAPHSTIRPAVAFLAGRQASGDLLGQ
ncbi:hypothetical protein PVAP13_4NG215544 [Panicum virgatum]|uniref:Uncharacterized protein n=1 Tax=Panicum virgatum TaxID=38727 RepID=A0A8T0TAW8_PANVG|nr:hypothetical protein PVAP13_4NG215544 [Panicum virgatum]